MSKKCDHILINIKGLSDFLKSGSKSQNLDITLFKGVWYKEVRI